MELVGIFKKNRKKRVKKWGFDTVVIFKKKKKKIREVISESKPMFEYRDVEKKKTKKI